MRRIAAACACSAALALSVPVGADQIDGVAAIVDDQVVLESEVSLASALLLDRVRQSQQPISSELRQYAREEALRTLINSKLILEFAERRDLAASETEIDQAISGIAQDEGVSVETVYQSAEQQGLGREDYRNELRNQITRMKVMQNIVRSRVQVEDEEVKALYEQRYTSQSPGMRVRVRHILIPWSEDRSEEADARMREIAEKIRQKAVESGAFANLARQFSRAPSAADGGLTVFREGEVAPQIATQVFGLPAGEVSPVIETGHGLVKMNIARCDEGFGTLEKVLWCRAP